MSMLDEPAPHSTAASLVASVGTLLVHGACVGLALFAAERTAKEVASAAVTQLVEVDLPEPPPPPEPPAPEPKSAPKPAPREKAPLAEPEAPPPEAAQAGQVLTAPEEEVVDFGDTFVTGKGESYAGGTTESTGTATHDVHDEAARGGGVPGGTGTQLGADLSRPPRLVGSTTWQCPFPEEADDEGVDHSVVGLRIAIGTDGRASEVTATSDPGHGFAREARRCALRKRWSSGLDRAGRPIAMTIDLNIRFDR